MSTVPVKALDTPFIHLSKELVLYIKSCVYVWVSTLFCQHSPLLLQYRFFLGYYLHYLFFFPVSSVLYYNIFDLCAPQL